MVNIPSLLEKVRIVKRTHEPMLLAKPNVVGVGIGFRMKSGQSTDVVAIIVMVHQKLPANQLKDAERIPSEIEGIPVDVQEIGIIEAQS